MNSIGDTCLEYPAEFRRDDGQTDQAAQRATTLVVMKKNFHEKQSNFSKISKKSFNVYSSTPQSNP